ncbi:MAG TPA: DUF2480 family protein [Candidatus Babeliaceae bacterium]|nr:DUF2480 family protein [Candidatus Babeliaceae bacterium]HVZ96792.1 DUF2480 family protein [Chitinophagaceae bacterium]
MEDIIINKVAQSALETIDLETFYPKEEVAVFDLKDLLFMGLILKEKEYRENLKNIDWSLYSGKIVAITCSVDAIIPLWAYMLATTCLQPVAKDVMIGTKEQVIEKSILKNIDVIDIKNYKGKKLVIKGCGDKEIPASAYGEITKLLQPGAQSIMYGEPCSTVPVYKKKN